MKASSYVAGAVVLACASCGDYGSQEDNRLKSELDSMRAVVATLQVQSATANPPSPARRSASDAEERRHLDLLTSYQEFLRRETEASSTQLASLAEDTKDLLKLTGWIAGGIAVVLTTILGFFGFQSAKSISRHIQERADKRLDEEVMKLRAATQQTYEARLHRIAEAYDQRQRKYLKLIRAYFRKLFQADPNLASRFLGPNLPKESMKGRNVLWVDDDGVGIALFVELLEEFCGMRIDIANSTEAALDQRLSDYCLLITNLRRDPFDDAGLRLARIIRHERKCDIPIILFTRTEHIDLYRTEIAHCGITNYVTDETELLSAVASCMKTDTQAVAGAR